METPPPLIMGAILAFWGVGFNGRPVESELSLGDILRILASPYFMDIDEERSGDEWSKLGVECPTVMQEKVLNIVNPLNAKYFLKDRKIRSLKIKSFIIYISYVTSQSVFHRTVNNFIGQNLLDRIYWTEFIGQNFLDRIFWIEFSMYAQHYPKQILFF